MSADDGASTNKVSDTTTGAVAGVLSAAIPARTAVSTRIRLPYYLIPGDLVLLSPMLLFDREKYAAIAVTSSNGGLLGLQQGVATPNRPIPVRARPRTRRDLPWRLGRPPPDRARPILRAASARAVSFKSTYYELPIVEFRPYRAFSADQSSAILIQLFAAPTSRTAPRSRLRRRPTPDLRTIWSIGLRMTFDWRYYWQ